MEAIPELSEIWVVGEWGWGEGLFSTTYKIDVPLQFNSHVKEKITKHKPLRSAFFLFVCLLAFEYDRNKILRTVPTSSLN